MAEKLCQLRKKGSLGEFQIPKGSYVFAYGTGGVSDISTYTSGIAITNPSTSLGNFLIVSPNGDCTIKATSPSNNRVAMKGYSNGRTVKTVAESIIMSKTEVFTNCDMIVVYSIGSASTISFTITDS